MTLSITKKTEQYFSQIYVIALFGVVIKSNHHSLCLIIFQIWFFCKFCDFFLLMLYLLLLLSVVVPCWFGLCSLCIDITNQKVHSQISVYVGWTGSPTRQLRRWCSDKVNLLLVFSILLRSRKKSSLCYTFEASFYLCHFSGACVYRLFKIWRKEEKNYNTSRVVTFFLLKKIAKEDSLVKKNLWENIV